METERFRRNQQVQVISDRPCTLCNRSHQGETGHMVQRVGGSLWQIGIRNPGGWNPVYLYCTFFEDELTEAGQEDEPMERRHP